MHQSFHARFELHKRAIGHQVDHLALDPGADGEFGFDVVPGIGHLLFKAKADAFLFLVDVQDHHVNFLPDL